MRILHCIPSFYGGGHEREVAYIASGLARLGHEVHVAYHGTGPNLEIMRDSGVQLHQLRVASNYDPRLPWQLYRLARAIRPDLIHTSLTQMDLLGGAIAAALGVPHILMEASSADAYDHSWKNSLRIRVGRAADLVVANSGGGAAFWRSHAPATDVRVVPTGMPLEAIDAAQAGLPDGMPPLEPGERLILFAGRLEPVKNVEVMTEAIGRVLLADPRARALYCGYGSQRAQVEAIAGRLGVGERLHLAGYVQNIWRAMKCADVFVSISHYEGRPNSVIEGMACGAPMVVSDIPAHREILDESSAILVQREDPAAVEAGIRGVLADPAGARRRAQVAQSRTREWSVEKDYRTHAALYEQLLRRLAEPAPAA